MSELHTVRTPNGIATASQAGGMRIAIFLCFLNAGITTRGIEIAKALCKLDSGITIGLFSWKGPESITYEHLAKGFDITYYGNEIDQETWTGLLKAEHSGGGGLLHDQEWMKTNIQGALQAIKDFSPTVVVHGVLSDAAVAAQILNIPNILYGPIPMWDTEWMEAFACQDIPDAQATWWTDLLPLSIRRGLMHLLFRQRRMNAKSAVMNAAIECDWTPAETTCSTLRSDYYILADLVSNYATYDMGSNVKIVGPMYAKTENDASDVMSTDVREFLSSDAKKKAFVTMGSTGGKEFIVEAVKAVCEGKVPTLVALVPSRCSIQEIQSSIGTIPKHVTLTESFVPADVIVPQVDVVIGHGGQGTVQTALAFGKPVVGVGMQWEQQFNLDNVARQGAGIRIDKRKWKNETIKEAVAKLIETESYHQSAERIQKEMEQTNGPDSAARFILDVARSN